MSLFITLTSDHTLCPILSALGMNTPGIQSSVPIDCNLEFARTRIPQLDCVFVECPCHVRRSCNNGYRIEIITPTDHPTDTYLVIIYIHHQAMESCVYSYLNIGQE